MYMIYYIELLFVEKRVDETFGRRDSPALVGVKA